jgi:DegV family protein with EDD domain
MNYKIVVDSTTYLPKEFVSKYDIRIASLNILDGEKSYKETEIDNEFIFESLKSGKHLSTSQPSPIDFLNLYEDAIEKGADIVFVITIAPILSGTYQSAEIARLMLDNPDKVHIFKSRMAAMGNEMLTFELVKLIEANYSMEEIVQRFNHLNANSHTNFTIENLIHVMRSGRLSKAKAMIGTVLRVKPILEQDEDGALKMYGSARTHKKVISEMIKNIKKTTKGAKRIIFRLVNKNSDEHIKVFEKELRLVFPNAEYTYNNYVGPIFTLHLGTNAYGLSWCSEKESYNE